MDMNQRGFIITVGVVTAILAITAVTATSWGTSTPLYTYRMEQQSNEMNFLPTEMNGFTYTTENGYSLNYVICEGFCGGATPLGTDLNTCSLTVCATCPYTACHQVSTCGSTCDETCPVTCPITCEPTCENPTCHPDCDTIDYPTCPQTCWFC